MIGERLQIIGAVVRKDVQLLRLTVVLVGLLDVAWALCSNLDGVVPRDLPSLALALFNLLIGRNLRTIAVLASAFLAASVVSRDPLIGDRRDWLVLPVRRLDLLLAKTLFIAAFVVSPWLIAAAAASLIGGAPLADLGAELASDWLMALLCIPLVLALASLTGTTLRALVLAVLIVLLVSVERTVRDATRDASVWIVVESCGLALLALSTLAIWLAYGRRALGSARVVFGLGALGLFALGQSVPAHDLYAVQQAVGPGAGAASQVKLTLAPGCFTAALTPLPVKVGPEPLRPDFTLARLDVAPSPVERYRPNAWLPGALAQAGSPAVAFRTDVDVTGAPTGDRLVVDDVRGAYVDAAGRVVASPNAGIPLGSSPGDAVPSQLETAWLLSRADAAKLAGARLRLDYDLTLLRPTVTDTLQPSGRGQSLPGLGYCSVVRGLSPVLRTIDCLARAPQPAMIVAGSGDGLRSKGPVNYAPGWLNPGGADYRLFIPAPPAGFTTPISLSPYRVVAHFSREMIAAPGLLGGGATSCAIGRSATGA